MIHDAMKSVSNPANIIKNKSVSGAIASSLPQGKKRGGPFSHIPIVQELFAKQNPAPKAPKAPKAQPKASKTSKAQPKAQPKAQKPKGKWVTNEIGVQVWHPAGYNPNNDPNKGSYFYDQMKRKDNNTYGGHTSTNLMAYYG